MWLSQGRDAVGRISGSPMWYSDSGYYMREINERLQERPENGLVDETGQSVNHDDWERMWLEWDS